MLARAVKSMGWFLAVFGIVLLAMALPEKDLALAQQPTGSIPTVTGTIAGPFITVNLDLEFVNVRSGPSNYFYPRVGVLMRGQSVPALGRSPDGAWIQVYYSGVAGNVGWVYAPNVSLNSPTFLTIVEPPPTPTLQAPTLNPTLVAGFIPVQTPTRLATYTPAPPVEPPVFTDISLSARRVPMGLLIFGFAFVGLLVAITTFLRGR